MSEEQNIQAQVKFGEAVVSGKLEGLRDVEAALAKRGVKFVVRRGSPERVALGLAEGASLVVCDRGYTRHQRRWRDAVADGADCPVVQVESDVVVPVETASPNRSRTMRDADVCKIDILADHRTRREGSSSVR